MCGVAGIINTSENPIVESELHLMSSFLKERGPDDYGVSISKNVGLAHRRLSFVDLSSTGKQPMSDVNGLATISFNGEIYNYKQLKRELEQIGAVFANTTDTEVIIQGYLYWGIETLMVKLDGMFSFAIYDKQKNDIYLCRDRFGKKPLYYFKGSDRFLFCSDIRSIHALEKNNLSIDYNTIDYYLTELSSPQPNTIWKEVKQVKPACYLHIDIEKNLSKELNYWKLSYDNKLKCDYEEAIDLIEEKLESAVSKRIHGDVEVGAFLSGGVDSGLVTAYLAMANNKPINTFTISFANEGFNEGPAAKKVAERYNTNHHDIELKANDIKDVLDKLIDYCGEPFADSSIIPTYYVCNAVSKDMKAVLSGDGGDEVFGGYYVYEQAYKTDEFLRKHPSRVRKELAVNISKVTSRIGLSKENQGLYNHYSSLSGADKLYRKMGFSQKEKSEYYTDWFKKETNNYANSLLEDIWSEHKTPSLVSTLMSASLKTRLVNDYLVKVDRASMINSLEVRSPFLDTELAETAASIPNELLFKKGTKSIIKSIAEKRIDKDVFKRKKQGFGMPLTQWLKTDLKELVNEVFNKQTVFIHKVIKKESLAKIAKQVEEGEPGIENRVWSLMILELWMRRNLSK